MENKKENKKKNTKNERFKSKLTMKIIKGLILRKANYTKVLKADSK